MSYSRRLGIFLPVPALARDLLPECYCRSCWQFKSATVNGSSQWRVIQLPFDFNSWKCISGVKIQYFHPVAPPKKCYAGTLNYERDESQERNVLVCRESLKLHFSRKIPSWARKTQKPNNVEQRNTLCVFLYLSLCWWVAGILHELIWERQISIVPQPVFIHCCFIWKTVLCNTDCKLRVCSSHL